MKNSKIIRIIIAAVAALVSFICTRQLCFAVVGSRITGGTCAVSIPFFLIFSFLAAVSLFWMLYPRSVYDEYEDDIPDAEETADVTVESPASNGDSVSIDESVYPELFKREKANEENAVSYPDIKEIIRGQQVSSEVTPEQDKTSAAWEEWKNSAARESDRNVIPDIYKDIPAELPEDYVPNYEEPEAAVSSDEEEYEGKSGIGKLILRIAVTALCTFFSIFIPLSSMTAYSVDRITVYKPFAKTEYMLADAEKYTVGVKLSGEVSIKVAFSDGEEFELMFDSVTETESFKMNFTSNYAYATFCDRYLEMEKIEKKFNNLASLAEPDDSAEWAYVDEITDGYLSSLN